MVVIHIANRKHSFSSFIVPIPTAEFDVLDRQIMRVAVKLIHSYYLTDHVIMVPLSSMSRVA